jgi:hypothetical protein
MDNAKKIICIISYGELKTFHFKDLEFVKCQIGFDYLKQKLTSDTFFFWHKSYAFDIKFVLAYWIERHFIGICMEGKHIVRINAENKNNFYKLLDHYDIKWINSEFYVRFV